VIKSDHSIQLRIARVLRYDSSISLKVKTCTYRSYCSNTESNVLERAIKASCFCRQIIILGNAKDS